MSRIRGQFVFALLALSLWLASSNWVYAGQSCTEHSVQVTELQSAVTMAQDIRSLLDQSPQGVALIGRQGSNITEHGLKYTHFGIARRDPQNGEWIVYHQLNACGSSQSALYKHGLANFMLDDLYTHDIMVVTLNNILSKSLNSVFRRNGPLQIFERQYNMLSYPGVPVKYQNSNQWVLEVIAQAQAQYEGQTLNSRKATHDYYLKHAYRGTSIHVSSFRRMMALLASSNVRFDDHPPSSKAAQSYEVVTVKSIVAYLRKMKLLNRSYDIKGSYQKNS